MPLELLLRKPDHYLSHGFHEGFEWVVVHNGCGFRCGYVFVPKGHPWWGIDDPLKIQASAHGGITFLEEESKCEAKIEQDRWIVGFDCAHWQDAPDPTLPGAIIWGIEGQIKTTEWVEEECKQLCEQAASAIFN